jgi:ATP-binding cassette, subfamily B, bacterial
MKNQSHSIPNTPFAFIWFAVKPYKKGIIWVTLLVILAQSLGSIQPYIFKGFIDSANDYVAGASTLKIVFLWLVSFPILNLLGQLCWRGTGFIGQYLTVHIRTAVIAKLFEYLSLHSLSYFNDRFSGALSEKVNNVAKGTSRLLEQWMWSFLGLFIDLIIGAVIIFYSNTNLGVTFLLSVLVLIPINLWLSRKQNKLTEIATELSTKLRGQVIDAVTNISAVQQYARRFYEMTRLDKTIQEYNTADVKADYTREWVLLINNLLIAAFIATIVLWSFFLWSNEAITLGTLIMIVTIVRGFSNQLIFIGQNLNGTIEIYSEVRNGLREIIRPHEIADRPEAKRLVVDGGQVRFENATFNYHKDPRKIFEQLSFEVKPGEKVGIVGGSGAGKTTLMKLLLRQHDITSGAVMIDGQDIREVTQESLREKVSIVPQEPMLFHRTIRENIMYGKLDATEEEMIEVAKKAQAHDFIELLPQKYDSLVGERGVKLSVGQRQRIAIARAFLKNAPILILDEATSALDSESEVAVQKALSALMEGKTVFAIAHRLSTLREMDRILVFKDGQIVEDGNHRTLLKNKEGVYASFWYHQAGGFIKDD